MALRLVTNDDGEGEEVGRGIFRLVFPSHYACLEVAALMRGAITAEANGLLEQGVIVLSPNSLETVALNFERVLSMPGAEQVTDFPFNPRTRLDVICAFATSLQSLASQFDLSWSSEWARYLAHKDAFIFDCAEVLRRWNAGLQSELETEMSLSIQSFYNDFGWRR